MLRWYSCTMHGELGYFLYLHLTWRWHIKLGHQQEAPLPCFGFHHGMAGPRDLVEEGS